MKAEITALAVLIAFIGFMSTNTNPWESMDGKALQVISDMTGSSSMPWTDTPWQPTFEQRLLIFGCCAIVCSGMVYTMRFRKQNENEKKTEWE
jgi:ABC-type cobalt transport system substrate-binding protein